MHSGIRKSIKHNHSENWCYKVASAVKNASCSFRGPVFSSKHWHDISEPPVILVPGPLIPSSDL